MSGSPKRKVLISGASIAGPALAYWLRRYGFEVTIVEKASTVRGGGYPIDVRGPALDVIDRMGALPQLRAALRNAALRDSSSMPSGAEGRAVNSAFTLPAYAPAP